VSDSETAEIDAEIPVIDEVIAQEDALPEEKDTVDHEPPPWANELIAKVEEIGDALAELAPNPVNPELDLDGVDDDSPVSEPWTHKKLFG